MTTHPCARCGALTDPVARFCAQCGAEVVANDPIATPHDEATSSVRRIGIALGRAFRSYDARLKRRWPRGRWVVHAATGLLLLGLVATPFSNSNDPATGTATSRTSDAIAVAPSPTPTPEPSPTLEPSSEPAAEPTETPEDQPHVDVAEEWTLAGWSDRFAAYDFANPTDSPLLDGTPRKLMQRASDSSMTEAIGDPSNLDRVSLVVGASSENGENVGELMGAFLNTYAPGTREQVIEKLGPSEDFTVEYDDGSVHVQTLAADDGVLVTVTVDRA